MPDQFGGLAAGSYAGPALRLPEMVVYRARGKAERSGNDLRRPEMFKADTGQLLRGKKHTGIEASPLARGVRAMPGVASATAPVAAAPAEAVSKVRREGERMDMNGLPVCESRRDAAVPSSRSVGRPGL